MQIITMGVPFKMNTKTNVDISFRVDDIEETARGDEDSWGYSKRKTAYFSNDASYIVTTDPVIQSVFGPHTISGEIFIKPFEQSGQFQAGVIIIKIVLI